MNAKCVWLAAVTFGVTLAALVVDRLDNQALAILTGAACGVVAGVPMTAAIFWISNRQKAEPIWTREPREPPQPVIVVQSSLPPPAQNVWPQDYTPLPLARPPRDFNIVGDEEDED